MKFQTLKKAKFYSPTWRVFAETIRYKSNKFHPLAQTSLEGLGDVSLILEPILYPFLSSSTFHKAHCLIQDFTWVAKLHQLAKPGNATVHG